MRKLVFLLLLGFLFSGCEKVFMPCIDVVRNNPENHLVSKKDFETAKTLLDRHNISLTNLRIYRIDSDYYNGKGYHIRCNQFSHGLLCFSEDIFFHIKDDVLWAISGDDLSDSVITANKVNISVMQAAKIFKQRIDDDPYLRNERNRPQYGCFKGELGYRDLNISRGLQTKKFVLAWKITPGGSDCPIMYLNAETGEEIYFWNGIIID